MYLLKKSFLSGIPGMKDPHVINGVLIGMWGEFWCVFWKLCSYYQRVYSLKNFKVSWTLHPKDYLVGASHSGDRDASNMWGKPWLYMCPRFRKTAHSRGLSLAKEMPCPWRLKVVTKPWAFVVRPRRTFLKLIEDRSVGFPTRPWI